MSVIRSIRFRARRFRSDAPAVGRPIRAVSGLLAMFLVLSACVFIYAETGDSLRKGAAAGAVAPAQVYRSSCIRCHDEDGRGGCGRSFYKSIPDFTDNRWQGSRDDDEIGRTIVHGKAPMAPMGKKQIGRAHV